MLAYVDTSALAKWYLNESGSQAFSEWIRDLDDAHISSLTGLEFRCLLARRKRMRELSSALEQRIFVTFQHDVEAGHLIQHAIEDKHVVDALRLLAHTSPIALRTLGAIHLQLAMTIGTEMVATADKTMVTAANELGMQVCDFAG